MRVPRRMRPALLAGFCFFVIVTVFFSRAVTQASQMDILMAHRRASLLERRFVEDGLMNIEQANQAEVGHEAIMEVVHEKIEAHPLTEFKSTKDELLALISVSLPLRSPYDEMLIISSSLLQLPMPYHLLIPNNHFLPNQSSTLTHLEMTLPRTLNLSRPKPTPSTPSSYSARCETHGIERSKKSWPSSKSLHPL
jgi:hypothetical protein